MNKKIKILDCTLRDGGYVNNWDFRADCSKKILELLFISNVDFIELGFLTNKKVHKNQTLFNKISDIFPLLNPDFDKSKLCLMVACDKFDVNKLNDAKNSLVKNIRFIFKKQNIKHALSEAQKIKEKGYNLFINPTYINQYNKQEFIELLEDTNKIKPYCFSIVDSIGILKEKDILSLYKLADKFLDENISICFHSHNNLQLSFSNALVLLKTDLKRDLIIDSTIFGMGRGAGNLRTELIARYLNENFNTNYNLVAVLKIIDEFINPIFKKNPWGYCTPYYLCAINNCHPNYAKFLIDKNVELEKIDKMLKLIPDSKKIDFDLEFIKKIYTNL